MDPTKAAVRGLKLAPNRGRLYYGNLTLDLDNVRPDARSVRAWAKKVGLRRAFQWRASASGRGTHVKFRIREGVTYRQGFALRVALGDDPVRAAIDEGRLAYHGKQALRGVLFDRKGDLSAGSFKSSRKGVTEPRKGGARQREKPSGTSHAETEPSSPRRRDLPTSRRTRRSGGRKK